MALAAAGHAAAQAPSLTNADVIAMSRAGLAPSVIVHSMEGSSVAFDTSPSALIALRQAGVADGVIARMLHLTRERAKGTTTTGVTRIAPERSDRLAQSKDPATLLRGFRTMLVRAHRAGFFASGDLKAALGRNGDFRALNITLVDDPAVADVVLDVDYTFAWEFPFTLAHQNTSVVLASGKGVGPLSGPAGAEDVARQLTEILKKARQ
jgi:hypothetical protein